MFARMPPLFNAAFDAMNAMREKIRRHQRQRMIIQEAAAK